MTFSAKPRPTERTATNNKQEPSSSSVKRGDEHLVTIVGLMMAVADGNSRSSRSLCSQTLIPPIPPSGRTEWKRQPKSCSLHNSNWVCQFSSSKTDAVSSEAVFFCPTPPWLLLTVWFLIKNEGKKLNEADLLLMGRHLSRVRFYQKLNNFGYKLYLKPVRLYEQENETTSERY